MISLDQSDCQRNTLSSRRHYSRLRSRIRVEVKLIIATGARRAETRRVRGQLSKPVRLFQQTGSRNRNRKKQTCRIKNEALQECAYIAGIWCGCNAVETTFGEA